MSAPRRLRKELDEIKSCGVKAYENLEYGEANLFKWTFLVVPDKEPYNKGAFKVGITFSVDYPFKPPRVIFDTKIYHPNVHHEGHVKLRSILHENWIPSTKVVQILEELVALFSDLKPHDLPLNPDAAKVYKEDKEKFMKNAEEFTEKYAEKRPE